MAFDQNLLAEKLVKYRDQLQLSIEEVAQGTGIPTEKLEAYEAASQEPSGDDILVLADFYKCDFKFFISNEKLTPFEETETLFRRMGNRLSKHDRWAIQEFLFLCDCEEWLMQELGRKRSPFEFQKTGSYFKEQGQAAATSLRKHLGHGDTEVVPDVYGDLRHIGLHVFRRELESSEISGLFIQHPTAGGCVLVNYSEDVYRQRFTAAHEGGHAVLDSDQAFVVDSGPDQVTGSGAWDRDKLVEIRANRFAACYLLPRSLMEAIPSLEKWDTPKAIYWAGRLKVNTEALAHGLSAEGLIDKAADAVIRGARVPRAEKEDPELPPSLTETQRQRKRDLLGRGLSSAYVSMAFDAFANHSVSASRLAEILLVTEGELQELASMYGRKGIYRHGD